MSLDNTTLCKAGSAGARAVRWCQCFGQRKGRCVDLDKGIIAWPTINDAHPQ